MTLFHVCTLSAQSYNQPLTKEPWYSFSKEQYLEPKIYMPDMIIATQILLILDPDSQKS